ncbi:uncharacterized protein LOC143961565 [Lithobates pipiens]
MGVHQLFPLFLLHRVTLFCAGNGDNMTEEYIEDIHVDIPRPAIVQNITILQCVNCIINSTKCQTLHHTSGPYTNHTTQVPSPIPSPTEYFVICRFGVCLRIRAIFMVTLKLNKIVNVTIPPPPIARATGRCHANKAKFTLKIPGRSLSLTFKKNKKHSSFYLGGITFSLWKKGVINFRVFRPLKALATPLGRCFSCKEVNFELMPTVNVMLMDVKAQAFKLKGGNFRRNCVGENQAVTPRPTTMQNITAMECVNCRKKPSKCHTTLRTTVLHANHTRLKPPPPFPTEYILTGTSGVCLKIKAIFMIMLNFPKVVNVTIPPPPITKANGSCGANKAKLTLTFPEGRLSLIFEENKNESFFYLGAIELYIWEKGVIYLSAYKAVKALRTLHGYFYICKKVNLKIIPTVRIVLTEVRVQAFYLEGDNFRSEYLGDSHAVIPRPIIMHSKTTLKYISCINKITKCYTKAITTRPHKNDTTQVLPSPTDYFVICRSAVCLRIKAVFMITRNTSKFVNVTIPPPPITEASGSCNANKTKLTLTFPKGHLSLIFRENKNDSSFYLGAIKVYQREKGLNFLTAYKPLKALVAPLGYSFAAKEVNLAVSPNVSIVFMNVKTQAFKLNNGSFGRVWKPTKKMWMVNMLTPLIYTVVFLMALPLNIMAIIIFLVKMKVKKPAVVYMLNLATADVLFVSVLPFQIVYRFLENNWLIGEGMCRFVTAAYYCNMYCSILLMTSISVDRFLAVVYPMRSLPWRTVTRAWLVCGVIWVISLASTVPLLMYRQSVRMLNITTCHDNKNVYVHRGYYFYYFTTLISLFFFLPLFITAFCYIGTIRSLSRSKFDRTHKRLRAIRLSVVVLSVFVLCFGPTNVLYFIHYVKVFAYSEGSLHYTYIFFASISSINCCLDPLIYYLASSDCRRYVYSLLCHKKHYRPPLKLKQNPINNEQTTESSL